MFFLVCFQIIILIYSNSDRPINMHNGTDYKMLFLVVVTSSGQIVSYSTSSLHALLRTELLRKEVLGLEF